MDFNRYFTFTELNDLLEGYQSRFPNLCRVSSIGQSHEGRPILLVTLTDLETGAAETKPALWADANLHATEVAGTTVVLSLIDRLLEQAASGDKRCLALLKQVAFYLVPRANPDGAERALAEIPEYLRSGVRRYPDTETDRGIHWQDIDGDGRILQMRIRDPHGDWKISSLHPQLMEKRRSIAKRFTFSDDWPETVFNAPIGGDTGNIHAWGWAIREYGFDEFFLKSVVFWLGVGPNDEVRFKYIPENAPTLA